MSSDSRESRSGAKECFVICPIGPEESSIRRRSDQVFKHVIKPAVEGWGYAAIRGDEIDNSGQITIQVIEKISNADLVIADLTDQNANVFYELALRHATNKPYIHMIDAGQAIPFDLSSWRAVPIDISGLDEAEETRRKLSSYIAEIEEGQIPDSPVAYAVSWTRLKQSDSAEERGIADLMAELKSLHHRLEYHQYSLHEIESSASQLIRIGPMLVDAAERIHATSSAYSRFADILERNESNLSQAASASEQLRQ